MNTNSLTRTLRKIEQLLGARRQNRTLWVWAIPLVTIVVVLFMLTAEGISSGFPLAITLGTGIPLALFMGIMSAMYLTVTSAEDDDET